MLPKDGMKEVEGFVPHPAVKRGDLVKVRAWLSWCKDVDCLDERERTPLIIAAIHNRLEIAKLLLKRGANTCSKDDCGLTALHYAASGQNFPLCDLLLTNKANPGLLTVSGASSLSMLLSMPVVEEEAPEVLRISQMMLKAGCNIDSSNHRGQTALHFACINSSSELIQTVIDAGASLGAITE